MIFIVWDTRGDGHDLVYWAGQGNGPLGMGWSRDLDQAREHPTQDDADIEIKTARDTVPDEMRSRVDVQELL